MLQDSNKEALGWNPSFDERWRKAVSESGQAAASRFPARVVGQERALLRLQTSLNDAFWGDLTGKCRRETAVYPVVGDWVVCSRGPAQERASIHAVLPRASCMIRREAGKSGQPQALAANVDVGFIVTSLNEDLSPRRIERYLATIWDGGARPVVLLTKRDLCDNAEGMVREIESVAPGAEVLALSALTGEGMESLDALLPPGRTSVLLGSSGAGKSTLVNRLFDAEIARTQPIRESDGRGRHTTTSRQLWVLPSGALMIDTPGMRELQLCADASSLELAFDDLQQLARQCRFTDCSHKTEPDCAVQAALASGELAEDRLAAHDKLRRELAFEARKRDKAGASREKARWKKLSRQADARMAGKRWGW